MPTLLMISGSLRQASINTMLVREAGRLWDGDTEMADIAMQLYNGDDEKAHGVPDEAQKLADQIAHADAVAIATPEYNQSFPGGLKNALDWVSRIKPMPLTDKPVAIMSAAAGRSGGVLGQTTLRQCLVNFQPKLLNGPLVAVAGASNEFDENGRLKADSYIKATIGLMEKLKATV